MLIEQERHRLIDGFGSDILVACSIFYLRFFACPECSNSNTTISFLTVSKRSRQTQLRFQ